MHAFIFPPENLQLLREDLLQAAGVGGDPVAEAGEAGAARAPETPAPLAGPASKPGWFLLARQAWDLAAEKGFETLLSAQTLPDLALYAHQLQAVRRVLQDMNGRAVLADEVGLGKTLEAGIVIKEYWLRGLVRRVLILVPANLVPQWQDEICGRLELPFVANPAPEGWSRSPLIIASLDLAKRPPHAAILRKQSWDMVVVDEAHRLKNAATANWRFVNSLDKKFLLLLTATPLQNDLRELYNMIQLLRPGQLHTFRQFKRKFMVDKRRVRNVEELRRLLSQVVIRTGRRQAGLPVPQRQVQNQELDMTEAERRFYGRALEWARQDFAQRMAARGRRNLLPYLVLLREISSSPAAALETLRAFRRQCQGALRQQLDELLEEGRALGNWAKEEALVQLLRREPRTKVLVYTEFLASQSAILRRLQAVGIRAAAFNGTLPADHKARVIQQFRDSLSVLVSTDASAEGHNFQFCHVLINYDLPWNPMRVEQRIGRVHRLGQQSPVRITNLVLRSTIEEYVVWLLQEKIRLFESVLGELDAILSDLGGQNLEQAIGEIILTTPGEEELARRFQELGRRLQESRRRYRELQAWNDAILMEGEG
ncbi:MAG: DEAD/DEAH box helicase [Firmicutes bacterium]|nr:DEAD/DEAH box helicase [Bacillota bacterium]